MKTLLILFCTLCLTACIGETEFDNDPMGNFEQLWTILDEKYCFFDYKNIDWDAVHDEYARKITPTMSPDNLFEVLSQMLAVLKDGHVNLASASQVSYYDEWYQAYPWNYREDIVSQYYLGRSSIDYRTAAGMKYRILDDNVGYIRYESFSNSVGEGNLDQVLAYLSVCNGIIIDVRDNPGGNLTNSSRIAARFTNEKTLTGYIMHKTGKGHNDFSDPTPIYVYPAAGIRWQKPVVVLTNRRCYSATNDFVNAMRSFPLVTVLGDTTGGGSGLPFSSELPNGWSVRFSASPHLDSQRNHIEFGIAPDIHVDIAAPDVLLGKDTLIEAARALLQ